MYDPYDFRRFITAIEDYDLKCDMIIRTIREVENVNRISYCSSGALKARSMGSERYLEQLKQFSFWLQNQIKPNGVSNGDFQLYRDVAEKLIEKGELNESVLEMFS